MLNQQVRGSSPSTGFLAVKKKDLETGQLWSTGLSVRAGSQFTARRLVCLLLAYSAYSRLQPLTGFSP